MDKSSLKITKELISFIEKSPTSFQAVESAERMLSDAGYTRLNEAEEWSLSKGGKYFWMAFVWAVPITVITLKISGRNVLGRVVKLVMDSLFVWTLLGCFYLQLLTYNIWMIFLLGIPTQMVLILWMKMKKYK